MLFVKDGPKENIVVRGARVLDPLVADAAYALIETQVRAGLVVRMAVLYDLLTSGPKPVKAEVPMEVA